MRLRIVLPFGVFSDEASVTEIVAENQQGSFGILPNRLDCAAAIVPGILSYKNNDSASVFVAVDEGVLVKTGPDVSVAVRRAMNGKDLADLRAEVEKSYLQLGEQEKLALSAMKKMEAAVVKALREMDFE